MKHEATIKHFTISLLAVIVSLLLILGSLTPVWADDSGFQSVNTFLNSSTSNSTQLKNFMASSGVYIGGNSTDSTIYLGMQYEGSELPTTYLARVNNWNVWYFWDGSSFPTTGQLYSLKQFNTGGSVSRSDLRSGGYLLYDSTYDVYFYNNGPQLTTDYVMPDFATSSAAISAFRSFLNGDSVSLSYTFDNGYLFVIDLGASGASYDFSLKSQSESLSAFLSDTFENTNQSYWFASSLPSSDDTVPSSGATSIVWNRGGNRNIYGQTNEMVSSLSGTSSGRYLCIYNPPVSTNWTGSSNPTSSEVVNYPVTISGITDENFWVYNTVGSLAITGSSEAFINGTITDDVGTGVVSDGAIYVTDSDGNDYVQTAGGATDISGASGGTIQNNIRGLQQTLDNFVTQFTSLLSAPISHIQQLISSGGSFMQALSQMFTWLPSPVQGVITSGLVVLIVIGVLKLLL